MADEVDKEDIRMKPTFLLKPEPLSTNCTTSDALRKRSFSINWNYMVKSFQKDNSNTKCLLIKEVQGKTGDLSSSDRMKLLNFILENVPFSERINLRAESLILINEILEEQSNSDINILDLVFYKLKLTYEHDPTNADLNYLCNCLKEVIRLSGSENLTHYEGLDIFLLHIWKEANEMRDDKFFRLVCSIIAETIRINSNFFSADKLKNISDTLFLVNDSKSDTVDWLFGFNTLFRELITVDKLYKKKLKVVLSILAQEFVANDVQLKEQCEEIIQKLVETDVNGTIFGICDIIGCESDSDAVRLKVNVIGCIRILSSLSRDMFHNFQNDEQQEIKNFFEKGVSYLLKCLLNASKLKDVNVSGEIMKFFVQILETPYIISNRYKLIVEQNLFWDILDESCVKNSLVMHSIGYLTIQTELFNKLQNLNINDYSKERLIQYFEMNSDHISSYNIDYVLQYYEKMNMCVCGVLNWKENCIKIIQEYYATSPYQVINVLKKAYMYCLSLRIDSKSIEFYIQCICLRCVINLPVILNDELCEPISEVLMSVDNANFEDILSRYDLEVQKQKDVNIIFIVKVMIVCVLKGIDQCDTSKIKYLLDKCLEVASMTQNLENENVFSIPLLLLLKLRVIKENSQKVYFFQNLTLTDLNITKINGNSNTNSPEYSNIDEFLAQIVQRRFYDPFFDRLIGKYFKDGKTLTFREDLNLNKLLNLYKCILRDTSEIDNYLLVLFHLKEQMFNLALFDTGCDQAITEFVNLLCLQMQKIYDFKFSAPNWLEINYIKTMIVSTLYGFIPYKEVILEDTLETLLRTMILDFHFSDFTTNTYINFINCCLYEIPTIMKHFIIPIMKILVSDSTKREYHFAGLEFVYNILNLSISYELEDKEKRLIKEYLDIVYSFQDEKDIDVYRKICQKFCLFIYEENKILDLAFSGTFKETKICLQLKIETNDDFLTSVANFIKKTFDAQAQDELSILVIITNSPMLEVLRNKRQIIVRRILEERTFYNVTTFGFDIINVRNIVIDRVNIKRYIENLVKISSICL